MAECSSSAHSERPLVDMKHAHNSLTSETEPGQRIQVSCGDANISPWALRMKLGTTALILRMVEQGVPLKDLALAKPLQAAMMVAHDSTLEKTITLANGKTIRAVELQGEYAHRALIMSEKTPLPQEEVEIIKEWQVSCDEAALDPSKLKGKADWATKRHYVDKIPAGQSETSINLRRAKDLQYDRLGEADGLGVKIRKESLFAYGVSEHLVEQAMVEPPQQTRAVLRGNLVRAIESNPDIRLRIDEIRWDAITIDSTEVGLDSRTIHHPLLQKIIDSAIQ